MRIAIGSDYVGFAYKERLKLFLIECGHLVEDFGPGSDSRVDSVRIVRALAEAVAAATFDRGIVIGATGHRETIVANRIPRVRCALCWDQPSTESSRQHDNANVLALGCRFLDFDDARALVECWLETAFQRSRHAQHMRSIDGASPEPLERRNNNPLPHRAVLVDEAGYVCDSCGQEFQFPLDLSAGFQQEVLEECPICCHENLVRVDVLDDGTVRVSGDPDVTH